MTHILDQLDVIERTVPQLAGRIDPTKIALAGHSLGGSVVWALLMNYPDRFLTATVACPGSPFGYGGTRDAEGKAPGISVQDATIYTTMQPCFGCAKELLQAHVKRVVYMHPWAPSDVDPEMGIRKRAEYDKLTSRLDVRQIQMADPRAEWAVTTLRKKPDTN